MSDFLLNVLILAGFLVAITTITTLALAIVLHVRDQVRYRRARRRMWRLLDPRLALYPTATRNVTALPKDPE